VSVMSPLSVVAIDLTYPTLHGRECSALSPACVTTLASVNPADAKSDT